MNATYFCNTFIQFSGLGYRVYYLNKFKNLKISDILRFSIDTIVCEILIFSLIGLVTILFIDFYSEKIINKFDFIYGFYNFFLSSVIYLNFLNQIILSIKSLLNKLNLSLFDKLIQVFLIKKENNFSFYKRQFLVFFIQYIILFLIFFLILKKINVENYTYLSLLITSLVDFSFLIALTPYSVGISEFVTFVGTRDIPLSFVEIVILINVFRICMILIYFICGPIFILINLRKKIKVMECNRCLSNQTIQSINLDSNNICQFCKIHDEMNNEYPLNENSEKKLFEITKKIKKKRI